MGAVNLQAGVWQGKRILSEKWVETVFERQYEFSPVGIGDGWQKGGMLGQNLMIIPKHSRVVAWQAASGLGLQDIKEFLGRYFG